MGEPSDARAAQREYFFIEKDERGEGYIRSDDEVLILPIDVDGSVLLARESSPAMGNDPVLILPGGTAEPGESPEQTANRELQEEIGMRANRLEYLGELWPWSKYLTVRSHLCIARDLVPSKLEGDEAQPVELVRLSWGEIDTMVLANEFHDARVLATLYWARLRMARDAENRERPAPRRRQRRR